MAAVDNGPAASSRLIAASVVSSGRSDTARARYGKLVGK
jgi:hypothetical protein